MVNMNLSAYDMEDYMKIVMFERERQLEAAVGRMDPDTKARLMALMNTEPFGGWEWTDQWDRPNKWVCCQQFLGWGCRAG